MQIVTKRLIKEIAKKHNVSFDVVKAVVYSQFECARTSMGKGIKEDGSGFLNVRIMHIGLFFFNKKLHWFKQKDYQDYITGKKASKEFKEK